MARLIAFGHRIRQPRISRRGLVVCLGVTIGDNSAIDAGLVVVKNVPENVVAVGDPCRVLRSIV